MSILPESIPTADGATVISSRARDRSGKTYVTLSGPPAGYTSGTLTFRIKLGGATAFEALTGDNSIDIAAPKTLVIDSSIVDQLEVTVATFVGSATEIKLAINNDG